MKTEGVVHIPSATGRLARLLYNALHVLLAGVAAWLTFALVAPGIYERAHGPLDQGHAIAMSVFAPRAFKPEAGERAVYLAGLLLMPALVFIYYTALAKPVGALKRGSITAAWLLFGVLACMGLYGGVQIARDSGYYLTRMGLWRFKELSLLTLPLFVWAAYRDAPQELNIFKKPWARVVLGVHWVGIVCITAHGAGTPHYFNSHFDAAYYAAAEVARGRQLLVDLTNIYGLYPYFMKPILAWLGPSVQAFTLVCAGLNVGCFALIASVLWTATRQIGPWLFGYLAMAFFCMPYPIFIDWFSVYFPLWPIRMLFPCVFLYLLTRTCFASSRAAFYGIFALLPLALLWNFESGVIVVVSWATFLAFESFSLHPPRRALSSAAWRMLGVAASSGIGVLLFAALFRLCTGHLPNGLDNFRGHSIFYTSGFYMLPMPSTWHPWMLVVFIYGVAFAQGLHHLLRRTVTPRVMVLFVLSVMGAGSFVYYQGRSHNAVLTNVWYPALLIVPLWIADLYSRLQRISLGWARLTHVAVMVPWMVIASPLNFLQVIEPSLQDYVRTNMESLRYALPRAQERRDFVARRTVPGEEILIVSFSAADLYVFSQTRALSTTSWTDTLWRRDVDELLERLRQRPGTKVFVFDDFRARVDAENIIGLSEFLGQLEAMSAVAEHDAAGTLRIVGAPGRFMAE